MNWNGYPICDARLFFGSQPSLREWQKNSVGAWCMNGMVMRRATTALQVIQRFLTGWLTSHQGRHPSLLLADLVCP
jgi:hypothetical protein